MSATLQTAQDALQDDFAILRVCALCGDFTRSETCLACSLDPWEGGEDAAFRGFCGAWLDGKITSWGEPVWSVGELNDTAIRALVDLRRE